MVSLYREDQLWRPLAELLSVEGPRGESREEKIGWLREAADLYRGKLAQPAEAVAVLERAVAMAPGDDTLRASLIDVLVETANWDRVVAVLRQQVESFGEQRSKGRAHVHVRLARALCQATPERPSGEGGVGYSSTRPAASEAPSNVAQAIQELRVAAEMQPADPAILYELARAALDGGQLDLSERTYRALLVTAGRSVATASMESAAAWTRAAVFLDLSEIALRRDDPTRGADLVDSALDAALERGDDPRPLEQTLRARGRQDLLVRALERHVEHGATLADRAAALVELAELWDVRLGRPDELGTRIRLQTERIAHDLDHEDRTDVGAWTALSSAIARLGGSSDPHARGDRLQKLLEGAIPKVQGGADRCRLRVVLARTLLADLRREAAIAALSSALADDPSSREALDLLSDVLEQDGRLEALVVLHEARLARSKQSADTGERVDAAWRLGHALEGAGRSSEALGIYESILEEGPTDGVLVAALAERLDALGSSRMADCLELRAAVDASLAPSVAARLLSLRDAQGDDPATLRALEVAFAADSSNEAVRDRLIDAHVRRADWRRAAHVLRRSVEGTPGDRPLLRRLMEACANAGEPGDALAPLAALIAAHPGDGELLSLRAQVRERLGDDEGAAADLEGAALVDSHHIGPFGELLGRIAARSDCLAADAYTLRLVDLLLQVNRPKQARRELERVLGHNPDHVGGLERIALLATVEGNWVAAADAYRKLLLVAEWDPLESTCRHASLSIL